MRNQDKKLAFIRVDEDGALARSSEFMKTYHNINIIVHTTGGDASYINVKSGSPNKTLDNIMRVLILNKVTRNNFGVLPTIMPYDSTSKLGIYCVMIFLTSYGMEQYLHTNISKYRG